MTDKKESKSFSFNNNPGQHERPDVKPFREVRCITSKRTGQEFIVTRIGHEFILPVTYYEKVVRSEKERQSSKDHDDFETMVEVVE